MVCKNRHLWISAYHKCVNLNVEVDVFGRQVLKITLIVNSIYAGLIIIYML